MSRKQKDEQIRMIGIDLDGTLLTREKELTAVCRDAVSEAVRAGIEVVPVTGRPLTGVPAEVLGIPGIRYVITSNGANTYDLAAAGGQQKKGTADFSQRALAALPRGAVLRKAHLAHDTVRKILASAAGEDVIREIFVHGVGYHDPHTQELLEERFSIAPPILAYINRSRQIVPDFEALLTDPSAHVENISLMFPSRERRDACFSELIRIRAADGGRLLHVLVPWKTDLEITHVQADKWLSLRDLGSHLGIAAEQVMTIGDGDNDRPMLRGAGLSYAMGNAPDFVKETADRLTADNEHNGAAAAIREMLDRRSSACFNHTCL